MGQEIDLKLIHISDLSSSESIDKDDLLLISKYDETKDKNYVSMKSTIGQFESKISSIIKDDMGIDEINRKINILENFCDQLSNYTISSDITNPYVISSMVYRNGAIVSVGGYELSSAINGILKNVKYDEVNSKTINVDNLSSGNIEVGDHGDIIEFINSSIEHMAAFYVTKDENGNAFQTYDQLSSQTKNKELYINGIRKLPSKSDYCVVLSDETMSGRYPGAYDISAVYTTRYSWVENLTEELSGHWEFKYIINNSPYTKVQWDAINSNVSKLWKINIDSDVSTLKGDVSTLKGDVSTLENSVDTINSHTEDWTFVLEDGVTEIKKTVYCYNS